MTANPMKRSSVLQLAIFGKHKISQLSTTKNVNGTLEIQANSGMSHKESVANVSALIEG